MARRNEHRSIDDPYDPLRRVEPSENRSRAARQQYPRRDERIRDDIAERLYRAAHLDPSDVSVEVSGGVVVLEGSVSDRRMKHAMENIVVDTPGVRDVENRIRVTYGRSDELSEPAWQGSPQQARGGSMTPDLEPPPGGIGTAEHREWLLDESIQESFPASDTPSTAQPGSLAAQKLS
ncbi:MAG: BON domain-containing protein [Rhodospirillaceae bacterium]